MAIWFFFADFFVKWNNFFVFRFFFFECYSKFQICALMIHSSSAECLHISVEEAITKHFCIYFSVLKFYFVFFPIFNAIYVTLCSRTWDHYFHFRLNRQKIIEVDWMDEVCFFLSVLLLSSVHLGDYFLSVSGDVCSCWCCCSQWSSVAVWLLLLLLIK